MISLYKLWLLTSFISQMETEGSIVPLRWHINGRQQTNLNWVWSAVERLNLNKSEKNNARVNFYLLNFYICCSCSHLCCRICRGYEAVCSSTFYVLTFCFHWFPVSVGIFVYLWEEMWEQFTAVRAEGKRRADLCLSHCIIICQSHRDPWKTRTINSLSHTVQCCQDIV